ncbi:WD40/YVTN/BNR-like repeat-containing protein [Candidatus Aenigmatarchaeota archaeon]
MKIIIIILLVVVLISGCAEQENQVVQTGECRQEGNSCCRGDYCVEMTDQCDEEGLVTKILGCDFEGCVPVVYCDYENTGDPFDQEDNNYLIELDPCGDSVGNGDIIISGPSEPSENDPDNPFRSLTVHHTNPDIVFVGTERNGFLKSTDGGETWERKRKGLWHDDTDLVIGHDAFYPEIYDIAISESNPDIMYAATVAGPGPLVNKERGSSGVYKSIDGGNTWERKSCGLTSGSVTSIWISPSNPDIAFTSVSGGYSTEDGIQEDYYDGGIFKTIDGGENWVRINVAENDNKNFYISIKSVKSNPDTLYIAGMDHEDEIDHMGLVKSTDGGSTWNLIGSEIISHFDISSDGNVIYGARNDCMGMIKSVDGGNSWSEHEGSCYAVAVSPTDSDRVLYGTTEGVYLSTNGLGSIAKVIDTNNNIGDIVFAPSDNNIVYVITYGYNLFKSTDGGENFEKIKNLRSEVLDVIP